MEPVAPRSAAAPHLDMPGGFYDPAEGARARLAHPEEVLLKLTYVASVDALGALIAHLVASIETLWTETDGVRAGYARLGHAVGTSRESPQSSVTVRTAPCPLCGKIARTAELELTERTYLRCDRCTLIFLHPEDRPFPLQEVLRYLEHRNDGDDSRYVAFLRRLADPVCAAVPVGARGLDFGCGPEPVLARLLTASGRPTSSYDPLFLPEDAVLHDHYDFVTCCEVVEHAHEPGALFKRLRALLRPEGTLAIMTRFYGVDAPFERWWYRRDPTHVCFFSVDTMGWIARQLRFRLHVPAPHVAILVRA